MIRLAFTLPLHLDRASKEPLSFQIKRQVEAAIRLGRLKPGDPLPSSRALAEAYDLNRNTPMHAYQELASEGWIVTRQGEGTFVAAHPPAVLPAAHQPPPLLPPPRFKNGGVLAARTGQADPSQMPALALARAVRRSLSDPSQLMQEAHPQGSERLRLELARTLSLAEGLPTKAHQLLLTGGLRESLNLAARALFAPGDRVAVEAWGHRMHWDILRQAGAILIPIDLDDEGLDPRFLFEGDQSPVRAVLLSPRCQYPTTRVMGLARRTALLEWAHRTGTLLVECDFDAGLHHVPGLLPPLAASDETDGTLYLGAFSKVMFPNLALAFIRGSAPIINHLVGWRQMLDQGADPVFSAALAELFRDGEFQRHLNRVRKSATERRDQLMALLHQTFGHRLVVHAPSMGLALWAEVDPSLNVADWAERGLRQGVAFSCGIEYDFHRRPIQALRMGYASHDEKTLQEIVRRMAVAANA